jgi:hypothetical protein
MMGKKQQTIICNQFWNFFKQSISSLKYFKEIKMIVVFIKRHKTCLRRTMINLYKIYKQHAHMLLYRMRNDAHGNMTQECLVIMKVLLD